MKLSNWAPKVLSVKPSGLICDSVVQGPSLRKEVMPNPPDFEIRDRLNGKFIRYMTTNAIQWISQYASLQLKFAEIAYRRIDSIESELWLNESLSISARNQLKFELTQLQSDDHPIWENAIHATREHLGHLIPSTIRAWMNESVDFSEKSYFMPHWESYPYSALAATSYLECLDAKSLIAMQVSLENYAHVDTEQEFRFYKLNQSIRNANKQARRLDLSVAFEEF